MAKNIIEGLEAEEAARLTQGKKIPAFQPGDTVRVNVRIKEGDRERVQAYEGVCIARSGGGLQESFTVRKISFGEGVERTFPLLSPMIESIEVKRRGVVRRAKLYYLRDRRGKSARIAERAYQARVEEQEATVEEAVIAAEAEAPPATVPADGAAGDQAASVEAAAEKDAKAAVVPEASDSEAEKQEAVEEIKDEESK